jgi:energy-coupling factor transporter ATP-binding protein EcfA2
MRRARDNPFAVHRVLRERYRLSALEWQELMARLERLGRRGAIVGPHGSGKTTLLEDLAGRLKGQGWRIHLLRFHADQRRLASLSRWKADDFVLCDGAEQLSFLDWRRLALRARSAGGFVVTTHRTGRLPVLHRCETSHELLRGLAASLGVPLSTQECRELHARHDGNLRAALSELYDRWTNGDVVNPDRSETSSREKQGGSVHRGDAR